MSATPAQLEANRLNAESSTGPQTEEGKKASSQNALKHGLACGRVIIEGENPDDLKKLKADLYLEHRPAGLTERMLVDKMALSHWFARRALVFQAQAFNQAPETEPVPEKLGVLLRYQTSNDRAFYKALSSLRTLQKERGATAIPAPVPQKPAIQLTQEEIGFVLQATPEQIWEHLMEEEKKRYPGQPLPEWTPEEKQKLLDMLR